MMSEKGAEQRREGPHWLSGPEIKKSTYIFFSKQVAFCKGKLESTLQASV